MSGPIRTDHQSLIQLANQECGYRNVWVEHGDTARWSNKGNLVVEHNAQGSQDVCKDGRVIAHQALDRGSIPAQPVPLPPSPRPSYPPSGGGYRGSFDDRLAELNRIYRSTSMSSSEKAVLERGIVADEMSRLLSDPYASTDSRLDQLDHVYRATSMSSSEKNVYERQIISDAVSRLIADRYAPMESRLAELDRIYRRTSMSSSEKNTYERQIIGQAVGGYSRY